MGDGLVLLPGLMIEKETTSQVFVVGFRIYPALCAKSGLFLRRQLGTNLCHSFGSDLILQCDGISGITLVRRRPQLPFRFGCRESDGDADGVISSEHGPFNHSVYV